MNQAHADGQASVHAQQQPTDAELEVNRAYADGQGSEPRAEEPATLAPAVWADDWPEDAFREIVNLVGELGELQALELWGLSSAQRSLLAQVGVSIGHQARYALLLESIKLRRCFLNSLRRWL